MKVLVTGGTGFVGSALVRHLLTAGYEVRVLARHKKNRFLLEGLDVEVFDGDIISPEAVDRAVKDCSIVFDAASIYAFYPFWEKDARALYKINVQGTINLLNAALKYKVERFIHTSTVAVINREPVGRPADEFTGFDYSKGSHYARSKFLAEQEVLKFSKKGLPAIILNPAIVIGERDYKPTPSGEAIVKFLNHSYPGYFDTTWAVADVDDVARAHISAIKNGTIGERYILCNKKHYTLKEIFNFLEDISGVRAPRINIPYFLLFIFVHIDEFLSCKIFKKKPLMPTEGVKFCKNSIHYDNSKAVNELGYSPTPIKETLGKAVSWYRKNGYIQPRGFFRFKANGSKAVKFIMQKLKMYKYTDKLSLETLCFFLVVKFLQLLKKHGIKPKEDGWRRVTQTYLRTEESKFALTAFRIVSNNKTLSLAREDVIKKFAKTLKKYPLTNCQLEWSRFSGKSRPKEYTDIVCAEFNKNGRLEKIKPYLELSGSVDIILVKGIIKIYNDTRNIDDKKRPIALKNKLKEWILKHPKYAGQEIRGQAIAIIDRILSATFISFERMPVPVSDERFSMPCFIKHKHPGFGIFNIICRFTYDLNEVDFWVQCSHIPIDGVPVQEILEDIKKQWGLAGKLKLSLPDNEKKPSFELASTRNADEGIYIVKQFIDFRPFLKLRKGLNERYAVQAKGNVTAAALFMWRLSQYRPFENIKFAVPVDLRAANQRERTLGFVFIRPSVYFDKYKTDKGFIGFQQEFNRQLRAVGKRRSESYKLLESYALVSPCVYASTLKLLPSAVGEFVGTLGITIIKGADIFIGPFSDIHTDGFIAISNFMIPAEDGSRICSVTIKGRKEKIAAYLDVIKEVAGSED